LIGTLGKRSTAIYLTAIGVCSVLLGLAVDQLYVFLGVSAKATVGQASEAMPIWVQWAGAIVVLILSAKPVLSFIRSRFKSAVVEDPRSSNTNVAISRPELTSDCDPN
jgi:hypothetical protein